jgi:hypothetical protein
MRHPFYLVYGLALLGMVTMAEFRGWSMTSVNEMKDVPKSIRDNPGAYRAHYAFYPRYFGGK